MRWLFAFLFALAAAGPAQGPPPAPGVPPPPPPQAPAGSGRIIGHIVAADNGAPVKRAMVAVIGRSSANTLTPARDGRGGGSIQMGVVGFVGSPTPGQGPATQPTDDAGRFEFSNLAAGRYTLAITPRGGFVRPPRSIVVDVADGATATVSIKLDRTGAVAGRVLDETGEPISRVQVMAMRRQPAGGPSRLTPTGSQASTDDLGQYRLFDLEPGQYYISATYREEYFGSTAAPQALGYAPTYYPGTAALTSAQPVTVRSARDTLGLDFSLARVTMGRVSGTVRDSNGQPVAARGGVTLTLKDGSMHGQQGASIRQDGTFVIQHVPPGEYYLISSMSSADGPKAPREGAYLPVTVNGDEQHVDLRLNRGATIRGQVIVEGAQPVLPPELAARMPTGSSAITVSVRPLATSTVPGMMGGVQPARVADDGTFELTGVRGQVMLMASGYRTALKSISYGAQDLSAKPMELKGTEQLSGVTIVLTTEVATVIGTVTNDQGEPAPETMVIAFPDDPDRWFSASPFIHTTRSLPTLPAEAMQAPVQRRPGMPTPPPRVPGGFSFSSLIAGRYLLAALESTMGMPSPSPDRELLEKLRAKATPVTVSVGQTQTVTLRVLKPF